MPFTQIVTVFQSKEKLEKAMKEFSTEKVVFITSKEKIKETIRLRNEIALKYRIPTEVKTVKKPADCVKVLTENENPLLNIIDHDYINYYLLNAAFITGTRAFFSNGHGEEQIPNPGIKFKALINEDQARILETLLESPLTVKELMKKTKLSEEMLYYYLHGKKTIKGLVKMGLVKDNDLIELTELGRLIAHS